MRTRFLRTWACVVGIAAAAACGGAPEQNAQLLDLEGRGSNDRLPEFSPRADWDLWYSYDCTARQTSSGFTITLYNADDDSLIEEDSPTIDAKAEEGEKKEDVIVHYDQPGRFYIGISSGCEWRVQVRQEL